MPRKSRECNPKGGLIIADAATVATLQRLQRQKSGSPPYSVCPGSAPLFQINKEGVFRPIYSKDVEPEFVTSDDDDEEAVDKLQRQMYKSSVTQSHKKERVRAIHDMRHAFESPSPSCC